MGKILFGSRSERVFVFEYQFQLLSGSRAIFTSTTVRDSTYAADPASLAALDANPALIVGIGDGPGAIGLTEVYNRMQGDWAQIPIEFPYMDAENLQDFISLTIRGGSQSGITVTYDDVNNAIDLSVP